MENYTRSTGTPKNFDQDRGGLPGSGGPYIGIVKNNTDPTRMGRLQVYIETFGGPDENDQSLWKTVSYCPPFYGATPKGGSAGTGTFLDGNQQSYGMWFTPPDIGTQVLCVFVNDDPGNGYYIGCLPENGITRMIPAIGGVDSAQAQTQNAAQAGYLGSSARLPVTEINNSPQNPQTSESSTYFDEKKPVHSYVAAILFQQGLNNDNVRGPIGSSAQRESPSNCYGISTPGRAIYDNFSDENAQQELESKSSADVAVIGRRGGHTLVMDDGDLEGQDTLVRIRTAKGHQITMSDDGNCFYICHANGQTWIELGQEGTLDVFTTNSINLRTQGTINLHADEDINMYAGRNINVKSQQNTNLQSDQDISLGSKKDLTMFSGANIGIKSTGTLALKSKQGSWDGGSTLSFKGGILHLNGGPTYPVNDVRGLTKYLNPDVEFNNSTGWQVSTTGTESIVTRAPTHEPYPYHNQGVAVSVTLEQGQPTPPPAAPTVPAGVTITKTAGPT
jgi:hypothetical protein